MPVSCASAEPLERFTLWFLIAAALVFAAQAVHVAWVLPVLNGFDEIQQYSFVLALRDAPTAFPEFGQYPILARSLTEWTSEPNYLAHPPLYYLLVSPFTWIFPGKYLPIRLFDILLATSGLVLAFRGFAHRLPTLDGRLLLLVVIFGLAETVQVAGRINNDDLLLFETGVLIWARAGREHRPVVVAIALAAMGWTKFNGFLAAAVFIVVSHLLDIAMGRQKLLGRASCLLVVGLAIGSIPTFHNLLVDGRPVWAPATFPTWFSHVPDDERLRASIWDYGTWFVHELGTEFPSRLPYSRADVDALPLILFLAILAPLACRPGVARDGDEQALIVGGLVATSAFSVMIWLYGWGTFSRHGILSEAQPRYFLTVWPLLAFAYARGVTSLPPVLSHLLSRATIVAFLLLTTPLFFLWATTAPD